MNQFHEIWDALIFFSGVIINNAKRLLEIEVQILGEEPKVYDLRS